MIPEDKEIANELIEILINYEEDSRENSYEPRMKGRD